VYDEQTKEMIYIGMKIISLAIHADKDNKKEILKMNGVEIIGDIVAFILKNSFRLTIRDKQLLQKSLLQNHLMSIEEKDLEDSRSYEPHASIASSEHNQLKGSMITASSNWSPLKVINEEHPSGEPKTENVETD
jgi:hypothetical protein